jgi:DNA-binding NtrC family response regulator
MMAGCRGCLHLRALNSQTLLNAEMRLTRSGAALAESARRLARSKELMSRPKHILVVDHDGDVRDVIADLLLDLGYSVSHAQDAAKMRALLAADRIDLIVLDASTSDAEAVTLATVARDRGIRLVMISGNLETMEAYNNRADQLLRKPFGRDALKRAVNYAFASAMLGQRKEDPD